MHAAQFAFDSLRRQFGEFHLQFLDLIRSNTRFISVIDELDLNSNDNKKKTNQNEIRRRFTSTTFGVGRAVINALYQWLSG